MASALPLILYEDDHLLAVNKPAGWSTHAPAPYAGEGVYDWLRHREPRWAKLALIHRLDKETSGVLVFAKSPLANSSLTEQFSQRAVRKRYLLLTDRDVPFESLAARSWLVRLGNKYASRGAASGGAPAETVFRRLGATGSFTQVAAEPLTGRTHQIRVQAAEHGFPVLGDALYGGSPAPRVCLHASELTFRHPATGTVVSLEAPVDFTADPRLALRAAILDPKATDVFRLLHGAPDGQPDWYVDRLGDYLLSQSARPLKAAEQTLLAGWLRKLGLRGVYHKLLAAGVRAISPAEASPRLALGEPAPGEFVVRENGVRFALSFRAGYSVGLFLDQRDNRRRLLANHVAADFPAFGPGPGQAQVLNVFAYTCGFSVCAALAGANTTSLDLSRKYLEWGKRNFALNGLDPAAHQFIAGEAFEWLRRLTAKGRLFAAVLLDPPTFSTAKSRGAFQAERDYPRLVQAALPLLKPSGVLFAATNAARLAPERFLAQIEGAVHARRRPILRRHYAPQPPDFPVSRDQPAALKTVWLQLQ
jgi:23S rRNA (cytosine1962-C5)-methyltransferase